MTHHITPAPTEVREGTVDSCTVDAFCTHIAAWGCSENTVRAYRTDLRLLLADHPEVDLTTFSDTAAMWLTANRGSWAASTVNRRLASFNKFADFLDVPGLQDYRRPKASVKRHAGITFDNVRDVLDQLAAGTTHLTAAETRNAYAMVTLCGMAGLRVHEAVAANWCDFGGPCEGAVELLVHGKGGKERMVPCPAKPLRHLDTLGTRELHTLTDVRSARWLIHKAFAACGYPNVESHQLRHAFATAAYKASRDIVVVQQLMGHADITTTQRYIGTTFAAGAAIVSGMETA